MQYPLRTLFLSLFSVMLFASSFSNAETQQTETQIGKTRIEKIEERASQFGLSVDEWSKYEEIMQGIRGIRSPEINPIWALGIHADTAEERKKYAELAAKYEYQDLQRIMAFQRAYDEAFNQLYGHIQTRTSKIGPPKPVEELNGSVRNGDRIQYFTLISCNACPEQAKRLLSLVERNRGVALDIHFMDSGLDDQAVQAWARLIGVSSNMVKRRQVTLNHNKGLLEVIDSTRVAPTAFVKRGNRYYGFERAILQR